MERKMHDTNPGWLGWLGLVRRALSESNPPEHIEALIILAFANADALAKISPTLTEEQRDAVFKDYASAVRASGFDPEKIREGELA